MALRVLACLPRLLPPMAHPCRTPLLSGVTRPLLPLAPPRTLHTSHATRLKEIAVEEKEGGGGIVVEGRYISSPRTPLLVKAQGEGGEGGAHSCPLCALNLDVKHTDVLILSQFMRDDGSVLPSRVTGLCGKQQKRVRWLIVMAQKAGLMPNLAPAASKRDPRRRFGSKKFNRYFDESTLPQ